MITRATVIKIEGKKAWVRAVRKSACEGCGGCSDAGKCHTEMVLSDVPKEYELEVENKIGAGSGDVVEIQSLGNYTLIFAFAVFVLPIIIAVATYFIAEKFGLGTFSAAVSLITLAVSFGFFMIISNKFISRFSTGCICKIIKENSGGAV